MVPIERHALDFPLREPAEGFSGGQEPETLLLGSAERVPRDNVVAFAIQPGVSDPERLERSWREFPTSYECRPEFVARVPGGMVDTRDTIVVTRDQEHVITDRRSIPEKRLAELGWPARAGASHVGSAEIVDFDEPIAAVLAATAQSYFHFWPESAARAMLFRDACHDTPARLLVQFKRQFAVHHRPAFLLLGILPEEKLEIRSNRVGRFSEVYVPSTAQTSGSALSRTGLRRLRAVLPPYGDGARRRIYASRQQGRQRRIVNEHELSPVLERFGFETVHADTLPLAEQAVRFSTAEVVLGVHGGALTNMLFAPEDCLLFELMPERADRARRQLFWNLAATADQPYAQVVCAVPGDPSVGTLRVDVRVDAAHLEELLASVLRP